MVERHPLNAPGGFYIENECCASCGVMHDEAPTLLAWDNDLHCFVAQQPETEDEIRQAIQAMMVMEMDCLRYGGADLRIRERVTDAGHGYCLDQTVDTAPRIRDHVTFSGAGPEADDIVALLHAQAKPPYVTAPTHGGVLTFSWGSGLHQFAVRRLGIDAWLGRVVMAGNVPHVAGTLKVHDWLVASGRFSDIRWRSEEDWRENGEAWLPAPV